MTEQQPEQAGPCPLERSEALRIEIPMIGAFDSPTRESTVELDTPATHPFTPWSATTQMNPEPTLSTREVPTERQPNPLRGLKKFLTETTPQTQTTNWTKPLYRLGDTSRSLLEQHLKRRRQIFDSTIEPTLSTDTEQSPEDFWPAMPEITEENLAPDLPGPTSPPITEELK
jgi:hypothetical protein